MKVALLCAPRKVHRGGDCHCIMRFALLPIRLTFNCPSTTKSGHPYIQMMRTLTRVQRRPTSTSASSPTLLEVGEVESQIAALINVSKGCCPSASFIHLTSVVKGSIRYLLLLNRTFKKTFGVTTKRTQQLLNPHRSFHDTYLPFPVFQKDWSHARLHTSMRYLAQNHTAANRTGGWQVLVA